MIELPYLRFSRWNTWKGPIRKLQLCESLSFKEKGIPNQAEAEVSTWPDFHALFLLFSRVLDKRHTRGELCVYEVCQTIT